MTSAQRTHRPAPEKAPSSRRRDIQGLRAIAVLVVVLFHAGLPLPGGFVGVDIFFVISGFVITAMLHREWLAHGRIRFGEFYRRRFRRLTPALALVVTVTMVMAAAALSPLGQQQVAAQTGIGAMLLVANIVIARTTGGYFDAPAETNPLLNTWSLSVEEQFYLVFPALIALGWLAARRWGVRPAPLLVVGLIGLGSLAATAVSAAGVEFTGSAWILGFYSPFTRAWEFAAGSLLALLVAARPWRPGRSVASVLAIAGGVMIAASLWLVTGETVWPGPMTLLPVLGTVLLIAAGATQDNPVTRLLGTTPMVKVGDWSYSIYLWHWPFIVFAVFIWPLSPNAAVIAAVASLIPALMSYHWVEEPIRTMAPRTRLRFAALVVTVMVIPLLASTAVSQTATRYWEPRFAAGDVPVAHEGSTEWTPFYAYLEDTYYPCANISLLKVSLSWEGIRRCRQSQPGADVDVALVGDSHAEQLFLGLAEAFPDKNFSFHILDALPVADGGPMSLIIDEIAATDSVETVIVAADWANRPVSDQELATTLQTFTAAGKQVFMTDGIPVYPFDAKACKYSKAPLIPISDCTQPREAFDARYASYLPSLESAIGTATEVALVPTAEYLCDDGQCSMLLGDELIYRDQRHVNDTGSRYLVGRMLEDNPDLVAALQQ